ncbi:MAG: efflux RND transporter permease subunit [Acidobacteriota bacterium]
MLRWLVSLSLRQAVIVTVLSVIGTIAAVRLMRGIPFDVFPEFAPPLIEIQTEAPGLSALEVESLVSVPIESAITGVPQVATIRSKSVLGLSSVVLILEQSADLMRARQLVQERLARATRELPAVAHPPVLLSPLSSLSRAMKIGLTSRTLSQMDLTTIARWTIRPRLMAVPGVANVAIWGQRDRQLQVLVDPDRLEAHQLTVADVVTAAHEGVAVDTGGFIDTPNQRLAIAHAAAVRSPDDLAAIVVREERGVPVRIGDVGTVVEDFPPPIGDAIINNVPGLLLIVEKQLGANTFEVTRGVDEALASLAPALGDVQVDARIFRPATFIEMSLANLNRALLFGCVLVVLVLIVFLADWRTALISSIAIPLSLLAAGVLLHYRGGTIDTMVLAGLVIALGEVVDDAIIGVENIVRRLRLNREAGSPASSLQVVLDASVEVRSAVVYGSLIVVLVFLPVFMLEGLSGAFFRPLALSYVLAIFASLVIAITLTPALSLLLLTGHRSRSKEPRLVTRLKIGYQRWLDRILHRPALAGGALVVLLGSTAAVFPFLGEEFLPNFREYDFLMHWVEKPGMSVEASRRITAQASRELLAIPGVRNFGSHIGRAEVADEVVGPNFTELWISLDPNADYDPTVAKVQSVVDGYPGLRRDLLTYLRERIKEVLTGASATVVVRVFGPEIEHLQAGAAKVKAALADVPGVVDLQVQSQVLVPQIEIRFRPDLAERFGLTPADVRRTVTTLVQGTKVGEFYENQRVFDVVVRGRPEARSSPEALRALRVATESGTTVPIRDVADIQVGPALSEVTREGGSRKIDVTCNVRNRDLGSVARDIAARLGTIALGQGYHAEVLGEYAARQASSRRLLAMSALALLGIFLLLLADFGQLRLTLLVFFTLPFALVGGVVAVLLSSGVLSLGSLVGLITVVGIAARNGIMLISHYRHLETEEGIPFGADLVLRGATERLAPILMTALATGLALLPIAVTGERAGQEIEHPLAVVIIGGLVTSTILNLFLLPPLYLRFGKART